MSRKTFTSHPCWLLGLGGQLSPFMTGAMTLRESSNRSLDAMEFNNDIELEIITAPHGAAWCERP
jgi:hypothetical protein